MKIDLKNKFKTSEGKVMTEPVGTGKDAVEVDMELKNVLLYALRVGAEKAIPQMGVKGDDPERLVKDSELEMRIIVAGLSEDKILELEPEDQVRLKTVLYRALDTFIAGQALYFINGKSLPF